MFNTYQKNAIFFSCMILTIGLMAMDFINPSLPYIMQELHASQMQTKSLIVFYLLGIGASQFFYGTFSDNYGRKKTILIAYIISLVGIICSSFAHSMEFLCISRFITGIGSGGSPIIARAIISDVCKDQTSIKKAFAYFAMSSQVSPSIAPAVGGAIQQYLSWRICFLTLFLITLIALITLKIFFKETHTVPGSKKSIMEQLTLYLTLFKNSKFMLFNFISACIYVFTIGYFAYMPFILFKLKFSPIENGMIYIIYASALFLGSFSLNRIFINMASEKLFIRCIIGFIVVSILYFLFFKLFYSIFAIISLTVFIGYL